MAPSAVHLPNGQRLTVQPVFGGLFFKAADLHTHQGTVFPPGWTIILHCEDDEDDHSNPPLDNGAPLGPAHSPVHVHRFRRPTLRNDHLFISSISNPSSADYRPAMSPTRQIAMMLWATLWWYFHQPEPTPQLTTPASANTPEPARPKGDWRVRINREGIFKGKHLLPKLERMGLIASEDSTVGLDPDDGVGSTGDGWTKMFVSRKSFWQLDARIYLFTLTPSLINSPFPSVSPASSRPASPSRGALTPRGEDREGAATPTILSRHNTPPGPFTSNSHLPTFYPPAPLQWTFTDGQRHPLRPKPPRQGETFYTRFIPSLGQYLSFRVASLAKSPCLHRGPTSINPSPTPVPLGGATPHNSDSAQSLPTIASLSMDPSTTASAHSTPSTLTDAELLHKWMNLPRVAASWGEAGPQAHQTRFLETNLTATHSFPVIGCFDGNPFGYFELYWVREDRLGRHLGGEVGDWDRGIHCLIGEQEFRGPERVRVWLSALVHACWLADSRTQVVCMEPRVDNVKLKNYCESVGFYREKEISLPHKQSNLMKVRREAWEAPVL